MTNADNYEQEMMNHFKRFSGKDEKSAVKVVCPGTHGKHCRLCDLCKEVFFEKKNKGTKLYEEARRLNRKFHYYSNIIFLANPSEVVVLDYGDKIFQRLISLHMDPLSEYKNFMHPTQGRNLYIVKTPGVTADQTSYAVDPRVSISQLPDMTVLNRLYPLDKVIELEKLGQIKPIYQSKLDLRTEIRILPSWLGPNTTKFYQQVNYHFNVSEDEFNEIQAGLLNPFVSLGGGAPQSKPVTSATPSPTVAPTVSNWDEFVSTTKAPASEPQPAPVVSPAIPPSKADPAGAPDEGLYPGCFGTYDPNNPECIGPCTEDGWSAQCQMVTRDKLAKRQAARRLAQ